MLPVGVALLTVLGTLAGLLVAVVSGAPGSHGADQARSRLPAPRSSPGRPSPGAAPVIARIPLTLGAGARLLPDSSVPAVGPAVTSASASARQPAVAPLRRTVQADLLIVAPAALPGGLLAAVSRSGQDARQRHRDRGCRG
jgi:hypothetical protein